MRIDLNAGIAATDTNLAKASSSKGQQVSQENLAESEFSPRHQSVAALAAKVLATPEMRQDKVDSLQKQIQNGTYQVSPAQMAASMLDAVQH